MAERAVSDGEAPGFGPVIVEGCDALVAVRVPGRRWCRGTGGLRADERLLETISDGERGHYGGNQWPESPPQQRASHYVGESVPREDEASLLRYMI